MTKEVLKILESLPMGFYKLDVFSHDEIEKLRELYQVEIGLGEKVTPGNPVTKDAPYIRIIKRKGPKTL